MKTNATIPQLCEAIKAVNTEHGYQLSFNRIEQSTKNRVLFTLKTPSKVKGARTSATGRNLPKASWHAHGHFFDMLFTINPSAFVDTMGKRIAVGFDWEDRNVGSHYQPVYMSETSIGE